MAILTQQVINGLTIGLIYALVALGLTMVYGVLRILHFAHGATYTLGAYAAFLFLNMGIGLPLALVSAALIAAVAGIVIERVGYRPLVGAKPIAPLIAGLGMYFVFQESFRILGGPYAQPFPAESPIPGVTVGPLSITGSQALAIIVGVLLLIGMHLIIRRSPLGLRMRAVADDRTMATAMGINVGRTVGYTFMLGSGVAAVAGVLIALSFNAVYPTMGLELTLKSFVIVVVGGLGSIPGALIASLLLGVGESLIEGYTALPIGKVEAAFAILIAVLLLRPQGLFGVRTERT